ncbi:MAG: hypothetical protein EA376_00815 [Phycisphaeraceae bacterium]|nr:MAG: hypothetical protein EA376_00815 [Phycisphaeraceae bacterium]
MNKANFESEAMRIMTVIADAVEKGAESMPPLVETLVGEIVWRGVLSAGYTGFVCGLLAVACAVGVYLIVRYIMKKEKEEPYNDDLVFHYIPASILAFACLILIGYAFTSLHELLMIRAAPNYYAIDQIRRLVR